MNLHRYKIKDWGVYTRRFAIFSQVSREQGNPYLLLFALFSKMSPAVDTVLCHPGPLQLLGRWATDSSQQKQGHPHFLEPSSFSDWLKLACQDQVPALLFGSRAPTGSARVFVDPHRSPISVLVAWAAHFHARPPSKLHEDTCLRVCFPGEPDYDMGKLLTR
jgi:hypothetical protein